MELFVLLHVVEQSLLQNGIKWKSVQEKKNSAQTYYSHFSRVTLDDHMKYFRHGPQEHLTDTRLVLIESRRAALPRYYESEASKPPESDLYL